MASIHSQMRGLETHEPYHFVQETDPGAVGSGLYWLQLSTAAVKRRNSDNTGWTIISPGFQSPMTTKGDLIVGGASGIASRLAIGSDGQALVADSTQTLGAKWGTVLTDPSTTKGDILVRSSFAIARLGIGTDGQVLQADSTQALGAKWSTGLSLPLWVTNHPDTPPASANASDDEFTNAATLPGGGSAAWTAVNGSNLTLSIINGRLSMILAGSSSHLSGIYKAVPSAPYTATCKISVAGVFGTDQQLGMFLYDGTQFRGWQINTTGGFNHQTWSTSSAPTGNIFNAGNTYGIPQVLYLQIQNNSTNFLLSYSVDGIAWQQMTSAGVTTTITPTQIGIGGYNSNANAVTMIFDWFRVTQP